MSSNDLIKYEDEVFFIQLKNFFKYIFSSKPKKNKKVKSNNIEQINSIKKEIKNNSEDELSKEDLEKLFVLHKKNAVIEKDLTRGQIYDLLDMYEEKIEEKKKELDINT